MKIESTNRSHSSANVRPTCAEAPRTATAPAPAPQFMLKKVLVPLDFSDCSAKAIRYAVSFASLFHVQMVFLHVMPVNYSALMEKASNGSGPLVKGEAWQKLETQLAQIVLENVPADVPAKLLIRYGAPAIEITNAAREFEADMIIMATHGLTGRAHSLIGSVASDVTRLAPCPVLVVHKQECEYMTGGYNPVPSLSTGYTTTTGTA